MKNLLTVFAFAASMLFGIQATSAQSLAQDQERPEVIAKQETAKMTENLGLSGDQTRAVFRTLVAKEVSYQKNIKGKDLKSAAVKSIKQKTDASLKESLKTILTADQYSKWLKDNQ